MEYGQKSWLGCAVVCFLAVVPIASVKHSIEDGMPNVALHKNIVLSNVSEDESRLAVDGNTDRKLGLCIIIETDGDVWWQVDLDDVYTILNILVIPTENFHVTTGQRTNFNLTTGDLEKNLRNTDYVVVNDFIQHTWEFVLPFPTRARFLKVHKKDGQGHFQLCEMEVYGTKEAINNVALNKTAKMSAPWIQNMYGPNLAVDGIKKQYLNGGSCFHTNNRRPWWRVDLGDIYEILMLRIYNRIDCCSGRTRNLILLFWSTREEKFKLTLDGRIRDIHNFYTSIVARFLELQLPFEQYFHLCEVEVYGKIAECQSNTCKNGGNCSVKYCDGLDGCKDYTCTCPTGYGGVHCENCVENVAIGKDIIASSTAYSSWLPNNVIDGDTNQYVINGATCVSTQKEAQPYLIIDLGVEYTLSSVRTYKRLDCCPDDISEFQLLIMLKTWISYEYTFRSTQVVSTIDLNPFVTTRLVRLQAKGAQSASLQLCEIEVFAVCQEGMTIKDEPIPLMQLRFSLSDEYTDVVKSEDSFIYWIRQELSNYTGFSLESFRNVKLEKDPFRVSFELHSIDGNLRTLRSMLERVDKLFKQGLSDLQTEDGQKLTITPRSLQYHVIYLDSTGTMLNGALLTTVCMLIVSITHM